MEFLFYFLSIISLVTLVIYVLMIINYIKKWNDIKEFDLENKPAHLKTTISVIVAVRNEELNILSLLNCLAAQDYPSSHFEIIIIDDHSEDKTVSLVTGFIEENNSTNIKLIQLQKINPEIKNKKNAIQQGIKQSTGDLIITTDADCTMGNRWLNTFVTYFELNQSEMIVAPVLLSGNSFFQRLQQIEFLSLIAVTASAIKNQKPLMCNGANLAYTRKIFLEVGGFENNQSIATGDDTFLMFKIAKLNPDKIHFLKSIEATVNTPAKKTIAAFIQQRIRWASKTNQYHLTYVSFTAYLISILNLFILLLFLVSIIDQKHLPIVGILFFGKLILDATYLYGALAYFRMNQVTQFFLLLITAMIYPLYILVVAFRSSKATYDWKGRIVTNKS